MVGKTRPLTPEHEHVLEQRIREKMESDAVVRRMTGPRPGMRSARRQQRQQRPKTSSVSRPYDQDQGKDRDQAQLVQRKKDGSLEDLESWDEGIVLEDMPRVDWAESPLMAYKDLDQEASMILDPISQSDSAEDISYDDADLATLYRAASAKIEFLWDQVCYPEPLRRRFRETNMPTEANHEAYGLLCAEIAMLTIYRRRLVCLLRSVWARELEFSHVIREGLYEPQALWGLRNLTAASMEAIEAWRLVFPWNHSFVYAGLDYVEKCGRDLEVIKSNIAEGSRQGVAPGAR